MSNNLLPEWLDFRDFWALPIGERVLQLAAARIGETEVKRNSSPWIDRFLASVGLTPGYAWCASFVYWTCRTAGVPAELLPQRRQAAAVIEWRNWAKANDLITTKPRRGDLMFWVNSSGMGHIGFVTSVTGGEVKTIEGNTNRAGSREGDGVYRKVRTDSPAIQFIALRRHLQDVK